MDAWRGKVAYNAAFICQIYVLQVFPSQSCTLFRNIKQCHDLQAEAMGLQVVTKEFCREQIIPPKFQGQQVDTATDAAEFSCTMQKFVASFSAGSFDWQKFRPLGKTWREWRGTLLHVQGSSPIVNGRLQNGFQSHAEWFIQSFLRDRHAGFLPTLHVGIWS